MSSLISVKVVLNLMLSESWSFFDDITLFGFKQIEFGY